MSIYSKNVSDGSLGNGGEGVISGRSRDVFYEGRDMADYVDSSCLEGSKMDSDDYS